MKALKIVLFSLVVCGLIFSVAFAAGDIEKGKALFNDPTAFSGTSGKSCSSCHPNGKGLENAAMSAGLEDTINHCIVRALHGKDIDPNSAEMQDIVAYVRSMGKKESKKAW